MTSRHFILVVTILAFLFMFFIAGVAGSVFGLSFMISTWYLDRNTINEIEDLERIQETIFETELFETISNDLNQFSDSTSEVYVIGLVLFIVSIIIAFSLGMILYKFRREFESASGNYLRLRVSSMQLTIIFSVMIAISLIFISSLSFTVISKNQTIFLMISNLINNENSTQTLLILHDVLRSSRTGVLLNVFNASFFGLMGIAMLFAKITQYVYNERANLVTEGYIFATILLVAVWAYVFVFLIGIDPAPSVSNPISDLNVFENSNP